MPGGPQLKTRKDGVVSDMVLLLHSGKDWEEIREINNSEWLLPPATLLRYFKAAEIEHGGMLDEVRAETRKLIVSNGLQRVNDSIVGRDRALQILSDIAEGKISYDRVGKGGKKIKVTPSPMERIVALKLMSDMEGWTLAQVTEDATYIEFTDAE